MSKSLFAEIQRIFAVHEETLLRHAYPRGWVLDRAIAESYSSSGRDLLSIRTLILEAVKTAESLGSGERFRHLKRGSSYTEIGRGPVQTSKPIVEDDILVAYRGDDGHLHFRPAEEFDDGRFEKLNPDESVAAKGATVVRDAKRAKYCDEDRPSTPLGFHAAIDMRSSLQVIRERLAKGEISVDVKTRCALLALNKADRYDRQNDQENALAGECDELAAEIFALDIVDESAPR